MKWKGEREEKRGRGEGGRVEDRKEEKRGRERERGISPSSSYQSWSHIFGRGREEEGGGRGESTSSQPLIPQVLPHLRGPLLLLTLP